MVQPLNPIGAGSAGQIPGMGLRASRPADILRADSARGAVQGAFSSTGSASTPPLRDVLTQLFKSLGLDTQDNKAMQTLIALLILMAVLESLQQASGNAESTSGSSANPSLDSLGISAYFTSTTITFEQTSTTIIYGDSASMADLFASDTGASLGDTIDYSI